MNQTIEQARRMVATFGRIDPGGNCWTFIKSRFPDLWHLHHRAVRENDLSKAATTFRAMIQAWEQSENQGELFT